MDPTQHALSAKSKYWHVRLCLIKYSTLIWIAMHWHWKKDTKENRKEKV